MLNMLTNARTVNFTIVQKYWLYINPIEKNPMNLYGFLILKLINNYCLIKEVISFDSLLGQLFMVELLQEEEAEVLSTATKPPGIVILGQNIYTKARLINEIFNRNLFPLEFSESEKNGNYRSVQFKHGHNLSVSLQLPDDYDLVDNLESYKGPWKTIPRKDLEINDNEIGDPALGLAVLEVNLNHVLLRHGARVIVSPSSPNCDIRNVYLDCVQEVSPILIYCYEDEVLPEKVKYLK